MVWGLNECLGGKLVEAGSGGSREQKPCRTKLKLPRFLKLGPCHVLEASNSKEKPGPQGSLKTVGHLGCYSRVQALCLG